MKSSKQLGSYKTSTEERHDDCTCKTRAREGVSSKDCNYKEARVNLLTAWPDICLSTAIAVTSIMIAWSTISFHRWTRSQRNPRPRAVGGTVQVAKPSRWLIRVAVVNTGDAPILLMPGADITTNDLRYSARIASIAYYPFGADTPSSAKLPARDTLWIELRVDLERNPQVPCEAAPIRDRLWLTLPSNTGASNHVDIVFFDVEWNDSSMREQGILKRRSRPISISRSQKPIRRHL